MWQGWRCVDFFVGFVTFFSWHTDDDFILINHHSGVDQPQPPQSSATNAPYFYVLCLAVVVFSWFAGVLRCIILLWIWLLTIQNMIKKIIIQNTFCITFTCITFNSLFYCMCCYYHWEMFLHIVQITTGSVFFIRMDDTNYKHVLWMWNNYTVSIATSKEKLERHW